MSPRNSGKLRSAAHRGQAEGAIGWIVLSVLAVLIILPLGAVLLQIVSPGFFGNTEKADGMSLLFEVFEKPLWYKALGNSMSLGIWTTFFGTAFGAFLANFRVKWEFKTAKLLDIAAWILMIMPSFIIAQGWVYFASGNGIARSWLHWNNINSLVFSFPGLVFIMVLNKFPFAYVTIKAALEWKPERLSLAARMNGASPWEEWKTVQAPLCIPAYCSAAILIFMDTIGDFGLPAAISGVYRFPTLPYAIYTALYSSPIRLDMAGVLSFYLVLIIIAAMIVQYRIIGKKRYDFLDTGTVKAVPVRPAFGVGIILDFLGAFLAFITLFVPLGSTVVMSFSDSISVANFSFTLKNYEKVIVDSKELLNGLEHSLMIAFAAAIIGLVLGFFVSYVLNYSDFVLKRVIDVLSLVALAVPGVVLGIGYIFVWNQRWIESMGVKMYGTPRIIVLASVAAAIPVITRVLTGGMAKIPRPILFAARLSGAGLITRVRTILWPLLKATVLSAFLSAFGGSVFNLAINTILYPPNYQTLPVYISKGVENLKFGYSAAATVFGGGIVVLLILLMELLPLYSQLFQRRRAAGSVVKLFRGQKENKRVTMKVQNS